jgi:hypothetical protein
VGSEPAHPPEAAQDVALVVLQVRTEDPPGATDVGLAVSVTVGAGLDPAEVVMVTEFEGGLIPLCELASIPTTWNVY